MKLLSIMTSTWVHKEIVSVSGIRLNSASSSSQGRQSLKILTIAGSWGGVTSSGMCLLSAQCTVGKGFVPGVKEGCPVC